MLFSLTCFDPISLEANTAQQTQTHITTGNRNKVICPPVRRPELETQTACSSAAPEFALSYTPHEPAGLFAHVSCLSPKDLQVHATPGVVVSSLIRAPTSPKRFVEPPRASSEPEGTSLHTRSPGFSESPAPRPTQPLKTCLRIQIRTPARILPGTYTVDSLASQPLVGPIPSSLASLA